MMMTMKIIQMPRNVKIHNLDIYAFVLVPLPDDAFQTISDSVHFKSNICLFSKERKGNFKMCVRAVFLLILSINLLVLSNESSPNLNTTAQNTFVLQYQKLGMIQCLKLRDFCSKSTGKPL